MKKLIKKKVLVFGTYDLLHPGHEHHLKKAAKYGQLYVVVARDKTVRDIKKKSTVHDEKERLSAIKKVPRVYFAFLGSKKNIYSCLSKIKPDIICLGYDQVHFVSGLKNELKIRNLRTKVIKFRKGYFPNMYKSSKIKKKFKK